MLHPPVHDNKTIAGRPADSDSRFSGRVKWHPLRQMLSERMHTVYSGAISVKQHKKGRRTDVIILTLLCVCRFKIAINEREGEDK